MSGNEAAAGGANPLGQDQKLGSTALREHTNQGRFVRSHSIIQWHGLRFATSSELAVAKAFDAAGAFYLPCAACRLSCDNGDRETRELDFFVVHRGVPGVLELDGSPHVGRAADDYTRDRAIKRAGVWIVERVPSSEALRDPVGVARRFLNMLNHYRRTA
jgi:hypothetical protein